MAVGTLFSFFLFIFPVFRVAERSILSHFFQNDQIFASEVAQLLYKSQCSLFYSGCTSQFSQVYTSQLNSYKFIVSYCPPIFTLDLPYMHEYITWLLHSIFNHRKDIVYRRSSSILVSVIRISYRKINLYECPLNIQRRLGLGVAYVTILVKVPVSTLG